MKTPREPKYRKRIGYQAMLLGGFSTLATILLVMGNVSTKDNIIIRQQEDLQRSLAQVIPDDHYTNNLVENPLKISAHDGKSITIYRGIKNKQVSALAWEISGQGYAGEMRFILALDNTGKILGIRVLSHAETPGLGDKMEVAKDDWILEFNGLSLGNPAEEQWAVKKDGGQFDAFTGATITPRGIVKAIVDALKFYHHNKNQLSTLTLKDKPEIKMATGANPHEQ
ncbi:MAG: electron transport complex subunit RsxG [gamma proteobacterium symbiont of Bathyaustriella thionipta]|nr:electron transport complex subunit RsxG [gamma proteobacterium symbiont of Bathyaustriella thionipta]MCU7949492.1 electron transport complex subunit RsxG [gamma proteobacterium symbiont of Bathyaustriella thionipta]MCU7952429.1 electron transport complex subunit RsxG [gamma proteobacterium symbiont of Bathyaustriella thionipta]MCU7956078.1 electron transport complex subunit RsxG [gamma proteobacterium symbiont of Bathyaustriella thionipta]MCU7968372.1 electron transport complex subunit RsxG 